MGNLSIADLFCTVWISATVAYLSTNYTTLIFLQTDDQMEELKRIVLKQSEVIMNLNTAIKVMEVKMEKSVDQKVCHNAHIDRLDKRIWWRHLI